MRNRSFRRHQLQRMKHRVADYYGGAHRDDPRRIGCLAATRTPCSCWMCGNPRRRLGECTMQERLAGLDEGEQG